MVVKNLCFPDGFCSGFWLTDYTHSIFITSIIVAIACFSGRPAVMLFLKVLRQNIILSLVELLLMWENFLRLIKRLLANISFLTIFPAPMVSSYSPRGSGIMLVR